VASLRYTRLALAPAPALWGDSPVELVGFISIDNEKSRSPFLSCYKTPLFMDSQNSETGVFRHDKKGRRMSGFVRFQLQPVNKFINIFHL